MGIKNNRKDLIEKKIKNKEKLSLYELMSYIISSAIDNMSCDFKKYLESIDSKSNYVIGIGSCLNIYKNITFEDSHKILHDLIKKNTELGSISMTCGCYGYYVAKYHSMLSNSGYTTAVILRVDDIID